MIPVIVFCPGAARVRASSTDVSRWTTLLKQQKKTVEKQSHYFKAVNQQLLRTDKLVMARGNK
ncbi:hypothetical protein [Dickeya sp. ws52]|uniref:hypothetical protein n=1 Tax=Dickeya sp. ws52 TaxID=2576377 RepID=UPI00117E99B3|nr:hypothetical protein [Dickeya sp. ws52]TYL43023.1 hypothetical protein FDP13_09940 [Dickeya sp. ws52]